jgi:hypothetical protein
MPRPYKVQSPKSVGESHNSPLPTLGFGGGTARSIPSNSSNSTSAPIALSTMGNIRPGQTYEWAMLPGYF